MKIHPSPMLYRILLAMLIFFVSLAGTTTLFYFQTAHWVKIQQHDNMLRAQYQLDSLLAHVNQSIQSMRSLIGSSCTSSTVDELRRRLAITPNVGNIELAKSGEVYCSSLHGEVLPGTERKEERSLYLTASTPSLPGHPFVVFHLHEKGYGLYTSTDGFYIRSILESASEIAPVVLLTEQGWMTQDGTVHFSAFTLNQSTVVQSNDYGYRLSSDIDTSIVFSVFRKDGRIMMMIFFCLSAGAGMFSFLWSGRPRTPEKLLVAAMKNSELHPYYQPIVRGDPAVPVGCEVLVRWLHKGELIPPDQFIPLAEETGLIIPLTRQLIIDVTDQLVISYRTDVPFYVSFNISARHLASPELEIDLDYFLTRVGSNISLVLEITEREIINGDDRIKHNMERLRLRGVRFALDDFGTGYSSLETLRHTPVELIKIDRMFTSGIGNNALCNAIIGNIVDLAKRIGAGIIAEGVETEVQVTFLRQHGEIACQGYLFSKPLPWNMFINWLNAQKEISVR